MREGFDLGGPDAVGEVFRLALLGEDHRAAELDAGHGRDGDAAGLDREDLVHALAAEEAMELPRHLPEQRGVDLVVEEVVDLQDAAGQHLSVGQDAFFEQFHKNILHSTEKSPS